MYLKAFVLFSFVFTLFSFSLLSASEPSTMTPDEAIAVLKSGNKRFSEHKEKHIHQSTKRLHETAEKGQHPFATVIACSDSRVPVELIFDQGIGDLFVIRVAGNVCGVDETGSIEYGIEHLQTPVFVVLGHTQCGAVGACVKGGEEHGSIPALLRHIEPAVETVKHLHPKLEGKELVEAAVKANVFHSIEDLFHNSKTARSLVKSSKLKVVGAIYDIHEGTIEWLGEHPRQAKLIVERK